MRRAKIISAYLVIASTLFLTIGACGIHKRKKINRGSSFISSSTYTDRNAAEANEDQATIVLTVEDENGVGLLSSLKSVTVLLGSNNHPEETRTLQQTEGFQTYYFRDAINPYLTPISLAFVGASDVIFDPNRTGGVSFPARAPLQSTAVFVNQTDTNNKLALKTITQLSSSLSPTATNHVLFNYAEIARTIITNESDANINHTIIGNNAPTVDIRFKYVPNASTITFTLTCLSQVTYTNVNDPATWKCGGQSIDSWQYALNASTQSTYTAAQWAAVRTAWAAGHNGKIRVGEYRLDDTNGNTDGVAIVFVAPATGTQGGIKITSSFASANAQTGVSLAIDIAYFDSLTSTTSDLYGIMDDPRPVSGGSGSGAALDGNFDRTCSVSATFGSTAGYIIDAVSSGPDYIKGLAFQSDCKIIAVGAKNYAGGGSGKYVLSRYNTNGSLDTTFGTNGRVVAATGEGMLQAIKVDQNNNIIVTGDNYINNGWKFFIERYSANGTLDTTLSYAGSQGGIYVNFPNTLLIDQSGNYLTSGWHWNGSGYEFAVDRHLPNGTLDPSFNGTGIAYAFPVAAGDYAFATNINIQTDGKILVSGYGYNANTGNNHFYSALMRLNQDGTIDRTFGQNGSSIFNVSGQSVNSTLTVNLQADGKILTAGYTGNDCVVMRLSSNGVLDQTFGNTGIATLSFVSGADQCLNAYQRSDLKIIVVGQSMAGGSLGVHRLLANGTLDTTYNNGSGTKLFAFPQGAFASASLFLTTTNQVLIGGYANQTAADFLLLPAQL